MDTALQRMADEIMKCPFLVGETLMDRILSAGEMVSEEYRQALDDLFSSEKLDRPPSAHPYPGVQKTLL